MGLHLFSQEVFSVLMEISWYRTRRHAGGTLPLRGKKKRGRGGVRLMGSSWIVVPFFFVPVPACSFTPSLGSACRGVLGERTLSGTTSTTTPNERPQKNSSNLSLPVAYYQSPRQSQIGSVGPVCAANPVLLRFHISEPFSRTQIRTHTRAYETRGSRICK